jgi:glycosyltransferase involved in cell wall biosynthesis
MALRAALRRLIDDPTETAAMGSAARRRVEEGHTTRQFAEQLSAVIKEIGAR